MNFKWILAPLLGCLIGYITNDIAIKMLFHPYKAVYIGKFHIPFTPGLIPSQKSRIARAVGSTVSENLLDPKTLQAALLSDKTMDTIRTGVQGTLEGLQNDERTVEEMLLSLGIPEEKLLSYRDSIKSSSAKAIIAKISGGRVGEYVSEIFIEEAKKALGPGVSSTLAEWGIASKVGKTVNDLILKNADMIVEDEIDQIEEDLMSLQMNELYQRYNAHIPAIVDEISRIYRRVIEMNLEKALGAVNISAIVIDKIEGLNAKELEDMVFGVMKRELRAIVYLGAALGFFMGFINILF